MSLTRLVRLATRIVALACLLAVWTTELKCFSLAATWHAPSGLCTKSHS